MISLHSAQRMHAHVIRHPHDATRTVRKISELAVVLAQNQNVPTRYAAHMIFDAWLDREPLVIEKESAAVPSPDANIKHRLDPATLHDLVGQ